MNFARRVVLLPAAFLLTAFSAFGQTYTARRITFSGSSAKPSELLSATGLAENTALTQAQMQAGAQALSDTGLFSDVRFRFDGQELHYDLKPADGMMPARYKNFPWWDGSQLEKELENQIPLFHGSLAPESGMQKKIVATLTSLLAARQIQATIVAEPAMSLTTGKISTIDFRITSPTVQIGQVVFVGTSTAWSDPLDKLAKAAAGQDYVKGESSETLTEAIDHIYRNKGYLDVAVNQISTGQPQADAGKVAVPITIALTEGQPYRLGSFSLSGSVLMSNADFLKSAQLKPGDIAEEDKLRITMQMLSAPYVTRGYLHAKINAIPTLHREQQTVDYSITVVPGDVCHMGRLSLENLDETQKSAVLKAWKLNEGDPFDASYPSGFLKKNSAALRSLDGYSAAYKQIEHLDTHIVDLVVTFHKGGPLS